MYVIASVLLV